MITDKGLIQLGFKPEIDFVLRDNSDGNGVYMYEWNSSSPQPTVAEIESAYAEWQTEYDGNAYQRTRADAYPELKEQFDLLYHDMVADKGDKTGEWFKAVKAVKDATPKP